MAEAKGLSGAQSARKCALDKEIKRIHAHCHTRCYGSPRMAQELKDNGFVCSKNRVARLMRQENIRMGPRKPFRPNTTQPDHAACPSPNLLAKTDAPTRPGEQLVSDITCIRTDEGWLYLAVVLDLIHTRHSRVGSVRFALCLRIRPCH